MKTALLSAVGLVLALGGRTVIAQPVTEGLEKQIKQPANPDPNVKPGADSGIKPGAEPGFLGLMADDRKEGGRGVKIVDVMPEGPADKAGLQVDDLITTINGHAVHSMQDMIGVLQPLGPDVKVTFDVERGGKAQQFQTVLGHRPTPPADAGDPGRAPEIMPEPAAGRPTKAVAGRPVLGVRVAPVTDDVRRKLGLTSTVGALISSRTAGSAAERAGLPVDAVVISANGEPVNTPEDLQAAVMQTGPGKVLELTYIYQGHPARARVTFAAASSDAPILADPNAPRALPDRTLPPERPLPPRTTVARPTSSDDRMEALEQHVQQLQRQVDDLQRELRASKSAPSGNP